MDRNYFALTHNAYNPDPEVTYKSTRDQTVIEIEARTQCECRSQIRFCRKCHGPMYIDSFGHRTNGRWWFVICTWRK